MLIRPIITEKSLNLAKDKKYSFLVDKNKTKHEIKLEIENLFKVNIVKIQTVKVKGGEKKIGKSRRIVKKPDQKKAIITLKDKQKIDLFETEDTKKK